MPDIARLTLVIESTQAEKAQAVLARLESAAKAVESTAKKLERQVARMEQRMKAMTGAVGKAVGEVKAVARAAREAETGFNRAERELRKYEKATTAATRSSRGLLSQLRALVPLFAGVTGYTALRSGVMAVASLEDSLAQVRGVAIRTTDSLESQERQFRALEQQALQLGATTRFTANQAAEGQLYLARTGFTAAQVVEALPATLRLAQAGMLDLGQAADIASNIITQFRLSTADTETVVDALVTTANRANTSVEQLAVAFSYAGPLTASLGMDVADTAAALGVLGDGGIQASMAGTNLRGVLSALIDQTAPVTVVIERLARQSGVLADQFNPLTSSLAGVLDALNNANATPLDLAKIFGRRNVAASIVLTGFADRFDKLAETIRETEGEAERLSALMDQSLMGRLKDAVSAVESLAISFMSTLVGQAIRQAIVAFTLIARELAGFQKAGEQASVTVRLIVSAVKGLVTVFAILGVAKLTALMIAFAAKVFVAATAWATLNLVVAANPLGLLAVAVGVAIAALELFKNTTVTIGDTTAEVGQIVAAVWGEASQRIATIFQAMYRVTVFTVNMILKVIEDTFRGAFAFIEGVFASFGTSVSGVGTFFINVWKTSINIVIGLFDGLFKLVSVRMERMAEMFRALINFDPTNPVASFDRLNDALRDMLSPKQFVEDFSKSFDDAFKKDYAGALIDGLLEGAKFAKIGLDAVLGPTLSKNLWQSLDLSTLSGDISKRIAEIKLKAKQDAEGLGSSDSKPNPFNAEEQAAFAAASAIGELLFVAEEEVRFARMSNDEKERTIKLEEYTQHLRVIYKEDQTKINAALEEYNGLLKQADNGKFYQELKKEAWGAYDAIWAINAALKHDESNLRGTPDERRKRDAIQNLRNEQERMLAFYREQARIGEIHPMQLIAYYGAAEQQVHELGLALDRLSRQEALLALADDFASVFTRGLEDAIFTADSLDEALQNVLATIARMAFQEFAGKPIQGALSSLFQGLVPAAPGNDGSAVGPTGPVLPKKPNAHGNVYGAAGHIQAFAKGAIFQAHNPVGFTMADGGLGVLGEGGKDEGIFPLENGGVQAMVYDRFNKRTTATTLGVRRMPNGDLGVATEFAEGGVLRGGRLAMSGFGGLTGPQERSPRFSNGVSSNDGGGRTLIMNVRTNDASSFRRSRSQIMSDMRRGFRV